MPVLEHSSDQPIAQDAVVEDRPRRVHGSVRLGEHATDPVGVPAFNVHPALDDLPEEQALTIEVNGRTVASLLCSPTGAAELALGWAFAHGYFDEYGQVRRLTPYPDRIALMVVHDRPGGATWPRLVASGFDAGVLLHATAHPTSDLAGDRAAGRRPLRLSRSHFLSIVERAFDRFRDDRVDGVHHAAVTDGRAVCAVARDLGRHNAVDKVVGWSLQHAIDRRNLILCLSGRVSADLTFKAWRAGFPFVVADALPTCEAVELAHAARITLVGGALGAHRAVYAHPWRLTAEGDDP
jgi:FdhD protein